MAKKTERLEPGEVPDMHLGIPGQAEPYPGVEPEDEQTQINDDEDEDDLYG